jgi:hypothetical protein
MRLFKRKISERMLDDAVQSVMKQHASLVVLKPEGRGGVAVECDASRPAVDYMLIHLFAALIYKLGYTKSELNNLVKLGVRCSKNPNIMNITEEEVKVTKPKKKPTKKKNESK